MVGGPVRVVLVQGARDWLAWFGTDPEAAVAQIPGAHAGRAARGQDFHDRKAVHGAGQVPVRSWWADAGAFNLALGLPRPVGLGARPQPAGRLRERRRQSPWDAAARRPSHGERGNASRRQCVRERLARGQR